MRVIVMLSLLLLFACPPSTRPAGGAQSLLDRRVAEFETHSKASRDVHIVGECCGFGGMLVALAEHTNIRICYELRPLRKGERNPGPDFRVADKTMGEILQIVVRKDRHYEYRERLGVIEVFPVGADKDPGDCLNMVVPALHVHYPWRWAWGEVRSEISFHSEHPGRFVPDPFAQGYSGSSHLPHPPDKVLEATFEKRTVREILDELSSMAGNVAWYASYDGPSPSCKNLVLGEYQPLSWHPPATPGGPSTEGVPQTCAICHYHNPRPRD